MQVYALTAARQCEPIGLTFLCESVTLLPMRAIAATLQLLHCCRSTLRPHDRQSTRVIMSATKKTWLFCWNNKSNIVLYLDCCNIQSYTICIAKTQLYFLRYNGRVATVPPEHSNCDNTKQTFELKNGLRMDCCSMAHLWISYRFSF